MMMAVGFVPNSGATAAEFESAARNNAGAFWMWTVSTGIVCLGAPLWLALIPALVAAHSAVTWVRCYRTMLRIRPETTAAPMEKDNFLRKRAARSVRVGPPNSDCSQYLQDWPETRSRHSSIRDAA
jgi:hypothetical protein